MPSLDTAFEKLLTAPEPLADRLLAFRDLHAQYSPVIAQAYEELAERLTKTVTPNISAAIGDRFPDFLLPDQSGKLKSLQDLTRDVPALISFNRGHWCHYCRLELNEFCRVLANSTVSSSQIISIIPESEGYAARLKSTIGIPFSVLSDIDCTLALELGLMISIGDNLNTLLTERGYNIGQFQGFSSWFLPIPAVFVVDRNAIVRARFVDPDFRTRCDPAEMIRALVETAQLRKA